MANASRERAPNREAPEPTTAAAQRRGPAPAEQPEARRRAPRERRAAARGLGPTGQPTARGQSAQEVPEAAPRVDPRAARDQRLQRALATLQQRAAAVKKHEPPAKKAADAQAAAVPPANEKLAGAQAQQVDAMKQAEGKKPESDSFLTLLRAEIEKVMPRTLGETDSFMDEADKQQLKGAATGNVNQQKNAATGGLRSASESPPDPSGIPGKEVAPLPAPGAAPATPSIGAAQAMPAPKPAAEVSLQASKQQVNDRLANNNITSQQLRKANDPRFSAVLSAKQAVEQHADAAPARYRAGEQQTLAAAAARAVADEKAGLAGMRAQRNRANMVVSGRQRAAKAKDEARRKEVADTIEAIYTQTKQAVDTKLNSLEADVTATFDRGIETALANMKSYVNQRKDAYKADRYGCFGCGVLWAKDKLFGLPDEVKAFYVEGRKRFLAELDRLIVAIAATVDARLKEAKAEVGKGQARIKAYVDSLPRDLQAVGRAAEREMAGRFAELRSGIDERKNDLAQKLAQRYREASDKADEALKAMQAEDKGLVTAFVEKLGEIITILRNFKNRILSLLRKAASVIDLIVSDPIGFLSNLLRAVKQGIGQFKDRIWDHLKAGFVGWLVGSLGSAGVQVSRDLSLPSILQLVMQLLGFTYDRIRAKAVRLIGERNVVLLERAWQLISTLLRGGPAALWEQIKEYLGDLKQRVIDELQGWVVTTIVRAAITKLATMFNPVGAIIQAIITIYNTVMFFVERINQIMALVEAIVESVHSIATGAIGAAANWIEQAMARTIPVIISFLARLLGLGGISDKIRGTIQKVQAKVDSALDKLIDKLVKPLKSMFGRGEQRAAAAGAAGAEQPDLKDFVYQKAEGGHTIRIRKDLKVFQYSQPKAITGTAAQKQQQAALESIVPSVAVSYPTDGLGRATGPSGHVKGVKTSEGRESLPPVKKLPGGVPAYQPGDQRGHLIGDRFYGASNAGNLVPMHATLNLSTFKTYENKLAAAYKREVDAQKGVLLWMQIVPHYSSSNKTNPASYRPDSISASSLLVTLKQGAARLTKQETPIADTFTNPAAVLGVVDLNTADRGTLLAARLSSRLVDAILRARAQGRFGGWDTLQLRLALVLGEPHLHLVQELHARAGIFVI